MKLFTEKEMKELILPGVQHRARAAEAHRWLYEFNEIIGPIWLYLNGEKSIERCRDDMREAFQKRDESIQPEVANLRSALKETNQALENLRYAQARADKALS